MKVLLIIGLILFILIVCFGCFWFYSKPSTKILPFKESFYFQVLDEKRKGSIIHDSGNDPSNQIQKIQILKKEINENKITPIFKPKKIAFGTNPQKLTKIMDVEPENIETKDLYYIVTLDLSKARDIKN